MMVLQLEEQCSTHHSYNHSTEGSGLVDTHSCDSNAARSSKVSEAVCMLSSPATPFSFNRDSHKAAQISGASVPPSFYKHTQVQ
jgi:hypothetical protein